MGTFTFKWPHAAEEVYVTGTFDNWSKSEKLDKVGDHFEKTVTLPESGEDIFYKFVVDGNWTTDHEAPIAKDLEGNDNNLLKVENIKKEGPPMAAVLNSVAPQSTTAALAGQVPLEPKKDAHVEDKKDAAAAGVPGTFPETPAADLDKQFSVNPLPAADFAVNPVELKAGEKVPEEVKSNGVNNHVTLDKESYEKSDRIPGLEGLTSPTDLAPTTIGTIIPESSLPIVAGDVSTINSAAPESTTAALAANVPLEHHQAPAVVKESQEKSGAEVGDSGVEKLEGEKIDEKAEVEEELLSKVPEAPSTAEGTSGKGTEKTEETKSAVEYIAAGAGAVGVGLVAAGLAAKDAVVHAAQSETAQSAAQQVTEAATNAKEAIVASTQSATQQATEAASGAKDSAVATGESAAQLPDSVKAVLPESVQAAIPKPETKEEVIEKISPEVPAEVKESIAESGEQPEAAANTAAVEAKNAVEQELLKEVEEVKAVDEKPAEAADNVPSEVKESIAEAGKAPEAASSEAAVETKAAVESELLKEVEAAKPIDAEEPKSETLPTEPAATSVESKLLDSAKDADGKPEASTSSTEPKAAESAPHLDLPTPPAVVPLVATPTPGPDVKTEAPTEFPTEVVNGSQTTSPKPAEDTSAPAAAAAAAPATPAKAETTPSTPAKASTPASAAGSKGAESPATGDKKKKNRLSSFFGKIKEKVAHKDKP